MTSKVNLATHLVVGDSIAALALFEDFVHRQIQEERLIGATYVTLRIERINLDCDVEYVADVQTDTTLRWLQELAEIAKVDIEFASE